MAISFVHANLAPIGLRGSYTDHIHNTVSMGDSSSFSKVGVPCNEEQGPATAARVVHVTGRPRSEGEPCLNPVPDGKRRRLKIRTMCERGCCVRQGEIGGKKTRSGGGWDPWRLLMLTGVEESVAWSTARMVATCRLAKETSRLVRDDLPEIHSRALVDVVFEQSHCRISNDVGHRKFRLRSGGTSEYQRHVKTQRGSAAGRLS